MVRGLIDPGALAPPEPPGLQGWVTRIREWSGFLRDVDQDFFLPLMSASGQAALATALGGIAGIKTALEGSTVQVSPVDIMKLVEGIRARSQALEDTLDPPAIAPRSVDIHPHYQAEALEDTSREGFEADLAHLAVATDYSGSGKAGIVSNPTNWADTRASIDATVELELWEIEGEVSPVPAERSLIKEELPLWMEPEDIYSTLDSAYDELLIFPAVAIEVAYRRIVPAGDRKQAPLNYSLGPKFVASIKDVGFATQKGRLTTVFRAAAQIACGRAPEIRSLRVRPYRSSSGGNSKDYERADGVKLMRGTLGTGPDAARIMWWDSPRPELLGIVPHDGDPLSLI